MPFEIETTLIVIFSIATIVLVSIFALTRKKRYPWVLFVITIIFLGSFGGIALFARDMFGPAPDNRVIPIDAIAGPTLAWMLGLVLLAKANHDLRLEKQYERTMALHEISKAYLASTSVADAAKSALTRLAKVYEADCGVFFTIDSDERRISVIAAVGEPPKVLIDHLQKLSCDFDRICVALDLWKKGDKALAHDLVQQSTEMLRGEGYKTVLGAPVRSGETILGMLVICARREIEVDKEERETLDLIAFELGLWLTQMKSIDRMRRLSETQKGLL
ncbi:MAG: GAF domain-containing protein, partial [Thermoplasmata archaeon]